MPKIWVPGGPCYYAIYGCEGIVELGNYDGHRNPYVIAIIEGL